MYNTSKYFSYIYADRNIRPCTIQGYTLATFPNVTQYIYAQPEKQAKQLCNWLEIKKGIPITWMVAANEIPKVTNLLSAEEPKEQPSLTEAERQDLLLEKLDLTGLEAWPEDQAEKAHSLLKEYHDIFSLEKHDVGHTKAAKHKIVLKNPNTPPFKERFRRIPPPQLDEVHAHVKMMLDAGVIWPSNSPWCNAVVLVRKKDGSLHFCIDF